LRPKTKEEIRDEEIQKQIERDQSHPDYESKETIHRSILKQINEIIKKK